MVLKDILLLQGKDKPKEELYQMKKMVQNFVWKMQRVRLESQDKPDGQQFCVKDVDDQASVQDDAEGPEFHKAGPRTKLTS